MPSSVGHSLAGLAVVRCLHGRLRDDWPHVFMAAAPDVDMVVGLLRDRPINYQNRRSHSIGGAIVAGAAVGGLSWMMGRRVGHDIVKATAAYASHLLLDYYGKDAESGLPLMWPISNRRFSARKTVFRTIYTRRGRFIRGLLTERNLRRVGREVALLGPLALAADLWARTR